MKGRATRKDMKTDMQGQQCSLKLCLGRQLEGTAGGAQVLLYPTQKHGPCLAVRLSSWTECVFSGGTHRREEGDPCLASQITSHPRSLSLERDDLGLNPSFVT